MIIRYSNEFLGIVHPKIKNTDSFLPCLLVCFSVKCFFFLLLLLLTSGVDTRGLYTILILFNVSSTNCLEQHEGEFSFLDELSH